MSSLMPFACLHSPGVRRAHNRCACLMWFTACSRESHSPGREEISFRGPCAPGHDAARTRTAESQVHCQDTGIFDGNIRKLRRCLEYEVQKPFLSAFLQGQDTFLAVLTTTENVIRITLSEIYQNPVPGIADKDIYRCPIHLGTDKHTGTVYGRIHVSHLRQ